MRGTKRGGGGQLRWGARPKQKQNNQRRIAGAAPADKERILNEAVNAVAKAVTDQGLSVEEYVSFLVAQNDPDVREKIRSASVLRPNSCSGRAGNGQYLCETGHGCE